MKKKICASCKFNKVCEDLPGFCLLVPYALIVTVVGMLTYFLYSSTL